MTITPARYEGKVPVRDGRVLGVAEYGPPSAEKTVLWFHGTPGARRQIPEPARRLANEKGVRLIGMDRPGVGLSTGHLYHRLIDFNDDLRVALDNLGVDRFAAVGLSGGAPYALAAAYGFGERVPAVGILGGVVPSGGEEGAPGGLVGFGMHWRTVLPMMTEPMGSLMTTVVRVAKPIGPTLLRLYARFSPPGDREVLLTPEHTEMFLDDIMNSGSHSMRAVAYDAVLFTRDWGFSVRDVKQHVIWWQGDEDNIVPLSHAQHIVPLFPDAELRVQKGGGHLSGLGLGEEVFNAVLDW